MTNVMEDMEDYVEYNDSIEPANNTTSFIAGAFVCFAVIASFFMGRFCYIKSLPTILINLTRDNKIISLYIDGHEIVSAPNENEWTSQFYYDLSKEHND